MKYRKIRSITLGVLLAGLPIWTLVIGFIPYLGFILYLYISHYYYTLPAFIFGAELFPTREFGTISDGFGAIILAGAFYAVLGIVVGYIVPVNKRGRR